MLAESARSGNQGEREFYRGGRAGASTAARGQSNRSSSAYLPALAAAQPQRRRERAAREDVAVRGAMDELDALAVGRELHRVLTDDVARAQRRVARRGALLRGDRSQGQRRSRWCIELARVVRFDDVAIPARQRVCGALHQVGQHRDAEAEIRRPEDRNMRRRGIHRGFLGVGQRGRAGHQRRSARGAQGQDAIESLAAG